MAGLAISLRKYFLLIEPSGIEMRKRCRKLQGLTLLLIEPSGIEIYKEKLPLGDSYDLLIEPSGIEIALAIDLDITRGAFNRTIWN